MLKRRTERLFWISSLIAVLLVFSLTLHRTCRVRAEGGDIYTSLRVFNTVLNYIRTEYVDKQESENLVFGAIDGLLATLNDPYTKFLRKKDFNDMKVETSGKFGGLGIYITIRDERLVIESPISGTPASRAGLKSYDEIIRIDGTNSKGLTIDQAVSKLRGNVGTRITITIVREGLKDPLDFTLIRDEIRITSVVADRMKENGFGYIRVKQFGEGTVPDLDRILKDYDAKKLPGIILDLRSNPGGLLLSAWKVADMFLEEGMIVYTKGRLPEHDQEFKADSLSYCRDVPLVVLVDRGSASASEIVTGALKDHKRATVVGQKTFGKGVVQSVKPVGDGLALSFTTAKYYTPSGICIHELGIEPDVEVAIPELSEDEIRNAKKLWESGLITEFVKRHEGFGEKDIEEFRDTLTKTNILLPQNIVRRMVRAEAYRNDEILYDLRDDPQLAQAVEILSKKKKK